MTIKRAIDHFTFKFKNVWKPTQPDIEALNTIMKFVEDKHKKQIQDYDLFAKLYITVYAQYLESYKSTVFDDIPKIQLHRLLARPVSDFIQRFTDRLNESERYYLLDELKIDVNTHPALKSDEERNKENDVLIDALNDKDNLDRFSGKIWDFETVSENIGLQINNVIDKIG